MDGHHCNRDFNVVFVKAINSTKAMVSKAETRIALRSFFMDVVYRYGDDTGCTPVPIVGWEVRFLHASQVNKE